MRPHSWLFILALLLPVVVDAQSTPSVSPGDRLRVTPVISVSDPAPSWRSRIVGTLDSVARDTIFLRDDKGAVALSLTSVAVLERSRTGKRTWSIGSGAWLGFLAGALVGGILGASDPGDFDPVSAGAFVAAIFAVPGMVIGGVVGLVQRERWVTVDPAGLRPESRR